MALSKKGQKELRDWARENREKKKARKKAEQLPPIHPPTLEEEHLVNRVSLLASENGALRDRVDTLEDAVYLLLARVPSIETNCRAYRKVLEDRVSEHVK